MSNNKIKKNLISILNEIKTSFFKNKESKKNLAYIAISTLVINFLSLATPLVILQTYDRILPNHSSETLSFLVVGVFLFILLEVKLKRARNYITNWSSISFDHNSSFEALSLILNSNLKDFESQRRSEYMKKIGAIKKLGQFYSGQSIISLIDLPFSLLFLIIIYYIAGNLVLVPILLITIFAFISFRNGKKLKKTIEEKDYADDEATAFFANSLKNVKGIKSLGLEEHFLRKCERFQLNSDLNDYNSSYRNLLTSDSGYIFAQVMTIFIITFGAVKAVNGDLGIGALAACSILSNRIMSPLQKALSLWTKFQEFIVSKTYLDSLYSLKQDIGPTRNFKFQNIGLLRIEKLSHKVSPENDAVIFEDLNLNLKRGESLAITSKNNILKKHLFEFIMGINKPNEGRIYVDNILVENIPQNEKPNLIGFLPKKGVIFKGSIWDNLTFFETTDEKDVKKAALKLGIDEDVLKLPQGYNTQLTGKLDDVISEGLKQRIAIARVLAKTPRIILYDNADAALDRREYNYLFSLMGRLKLKTSMILCSDDNNILTLADTTYHFESGKIVKEEDIQVDLSDLVPLRLDDKDAG